MDNTQYSILEKLYNQKSQSMTLVDLANSKIITPDCIHDIIKIMKKKNYVFEKNFSGIIELSEIGINAFESEQEHRKAIAEQKAAYEEEKAANKKELRFNKIISITSLAVSSILAIWEIISNFFFK